MTTINVEVLKTCYSGTGVEVRDVGIVEVKQKDVASPEVVMDTEHMESADLVLLANRLLWPASDDEGVAPEGVSGPYVFWIRESGIWNDVHEGVAAEAFNALLTGYGQPIEARGLVFDKADRPAAVVFVLHALLFAWDAYLIPLSGSFVCHLNHDGYVQVSADNGACAAWLSDRLGAWESQTTS